MLSRARLRRAAALAALLVVAGGGVAHAGGSSDGLWYYSASGMEQLHQRTTGDGVTIAVIDTAINPAAPGLESADVRVREPSYCAPKDSDALPATGDGQPTEHGTTITSLLVGSGARADGKPGVRGVAPGASVHFYSVAPGAQDSSCTGVAGGSQQAFRDAVADGADIVNVSMIADLPVEDYAAALRAGVVVVASAGNTGGDAIMPPADLNGIVAVGTVTPELTLDPGSPSGPALGVVAPGTGFLCYAADFVTEGRCTGSSNAAAYTSGVLALAMSAYPDATSNQLLQALVRSTDGEAVHEPRRDDSWGYGLVSARLLLETDPSTFPDVNPFVRDDAGLEPSAAALTGAGPAPTQPPGTDAEAERGDTAAPEEDAEDGGAPLLLIAGAAVGLLVVAGVVVGAVLAARRRPAPQAHGPQGPDGAVP